ncbi:MULTISPECIES: hypothetical protein [unclassified Sphingobium]|uniref:hypothetical protein n=1 Tax=unclassified Sphingobium TaxID=2611147 RepID=UPI0035A6DC30
MFVGIDRTSGFAATPLVGKADRRMAGEFVQHLLKAVPYCILKNLAGHGPGSLTSHAIAP